MITTVYQNHFSVERGCKTFRKRYENDSADEDRFHCESAFLYLPGVVWTGPHSHSLSERPAAAVAECELRGTPTD